MLEVSGLSLQRGSASLGPLSFSLPHPGCWWLAGVSGAGKSLLLESLAGFHAGAKGSIRVGMGDNKREVGELAPERRSIALMPQRWRLFPHWTARRNLNFAAKLGGAERPSRSLNLERLAERLEVAPLLDRPVRALSGGETQRIALLQTLLSPAQVLLLDEPLSAVEAALQSTALDLLQGESATNHRICLIAVHHPTMGYALQGTLFLEKGFLLKSAPATEPIAIESTI